jgi:hypothetical protein
MPPNDAHEDPLEELFGGIVAGNPYRPPRTYHSAIASVYAEGVQERRQIGTTLAARSPRTKLENEFNET